VFFAKVFILKGLTMYFLGKVFIPDTLAASRSLQMKNPRFSAWEVCSSISILIVGMELIGHSIRQDWRGVLLVGA
jgi:hypothetical protein